MKYYYFLIISLFIFSKVSIAQDYWKPLNGPEGVSIQQAGLDLFGNYYIGTRGIENVFRSTDNGETWQNFEDGLPADIHRFGFKFANAPDSSFYMILKHRLYVIRPHTTIWERLSNIGSINNISISPNGNIYVSNSTKVYISTDKGATFNSIFKVEDEAILSTNGNNKNFVIDIEGEQRKNLFSFDDNGENLKEITVPIKYLKGVLYDSISGKLFIYSHNGLYMSEDDGQTWNIILDEDSPSPHHMVISPSGIMYCSTYGGMIISKDLGQTWKTVHKDIYPFTYELTNILFPNENSIIVLGNTDWKHFIRFGIAPADFNSIKEIKPNVKQPFIINIFEDPNKTIYAELGDKNFLFSNDDWQSSNEIKLNDSNEKIEFLDHENNGTIYVISTLKNVYWTSDKGLTWGNISPPVDSLSKYESISVSPTGTIYLLTNKRTLYVSKDKGENWVNVFNVPLSTYHNKFYFNSKEEIFAVNWNKIMVSKDNGNSWKNLISDDKVKLSRKVFHITKSDDILFVGEINDSISGFSRGLIKWEDDIAKILDDNIFGIEYIESNVAGDIFVGASKGIFKLEKNSKNWEDISYELIYDINNAPGLFIDKDQYLYAFPKHDKIYKSIKPTTNSHTVLGKVFYDEFNNCQKDYGEIEFYNWLVSIDGVVKKSIKTNIYGNYSFNLPDGDYQIKINIPDSILWQSCKNNIDFTLNGTQLDTTIILFPIQRIPNTINQLNKTKIKIYPQPFSYKANITIEGLEISKNSVFEVFNNLGKKVFSKSINSNNFDFYRNNLSNGIYYYKIGIKSKILSTGKLVIQ